MRCERKGVVDFFSTLLNRYNRDKKREKNEKEKHLRKKFSKY